MNLLTAMSDAIYLVNVRLLLLRKVKKISSWWEVFRKKSSKCKNAKYFSPLPCENVFIQLVWLCMRIEFRTLNFCKVCYDHYLRSRASRYLSLSSPSSSSHLSVKSLRFFCFLTIVEILVLIYLDTLHPRILETVLTLVLHYNLSFFVWKKGFFVIRLQSSHNPFWFSLLTYVQRIRW